MVEEAVYKITGVKEARAVIRGTHEVDHEVAVVVHGVAPSPITINLPSKGISASAVRRLQESDLPLSRPPFPDNVSAEDLVNMSQEGKDRLRQWLINELKAVSEHEDVRGAHMDSEDSGIEVLPTSQPTRWEFDLALSAPQASKSTEVLVPPEVNRSLNGHRYESQRTREINDIQPVDSGYRKEEEEAGLTDTTEKDPAQTPSESGLGQTIDHSGLAQVPRQKKGGSSRSLTPKVTSTSPRPTEATLVEKQPKWTARPMEQPQVHLGCGKQSCDNPGCMAQRVVDRAIALRDHLNGRKTRSDPAAGTSASTQSPDSAAEPEKPCSDVRKLGQSLQLSCRLQCLVNLLVTATSLQLLLGTTCEDEKDTNPTVQQSEGSNVDSSPSSSNDTAGQIGKCMEAEGKRINDDQSTCHDPDQSDSSRRSGTKGMVGNAKGDALAGGDSNPRRKSHDEKKSGGYHYR